MDFSYTEDQMRIKRLVREFAEKELAPIEHKIEEENMVPMDIRRKLGELGLYGLPFPTEYGGVGAGWLTAIIAIEELSRVCAAAGMVCGAQTLASEAIYSFGTEEQKRKYLPQLLSGEKIGCFAFTEPGTGSDPKALVTKAEQVGDKFILNGQKRFISNAPLADIALIFAGDGDGISLFLIEDAKNTSGFSTGKPEDFMGLRGNVVSDIFLDNVEVPAENVVGPRGKAMRILMSVIAAGKLYLCAEAMGIMQAAIEESVKYAKDKIVRGRPLSDMQFIYGMIAEMQTRLEASRWLTYSAAYLKDQGKNILKESAIAKLFVSDAVVDVTRKAVQIHGSYGYSKEYKVEKLYRDAKAFELVEGTSEIQKSIIGPMVVRELAEMV